MGGRLRALPCALGCLPAFVGTSESMARFPRLRRAVFVVSAALVSAPPLRRMGLSAKSDAALAVACVTRHTLKSALGDVGAGRR